jgi:2-keto-3-deoxy-L-rhamnonate aldolase RhmA
MNQKQIKKRLQKGEVLIGTWISMGHPGIAEIMARAGYDWVVVDLEHSVISIEAAADLIRVIDLCGSAPLVRLTSNQPDQIKRVMDAGAHGIIVPMVNTVEDAKQAVDAVRYAPDGSRGVGLARAQGYGSDFKNYLEWQKKESLVIVQIEHKQALEALEEILKVPGVDGLIIGPYDLSCSMGIPGMFEHPDFKKAMDYILETGKKLSVPTGLHIVEPDEDLLAKCVNEGYRFIAYSVDIRILDVVARQGIVKFRELNQ